MIELEYAFFAKHVEVAADAKFHALDAGINMVRIDRCPGTIPSLGFLARLRADSEECGKVHHVRVDVVDPQGEFRKGETASTFDLTKTAGTSPFLVHLTFGMNIHQFQVPALGVYEFRVVHLEAQKRLGSIRLIIELADPLIR